MTDTLPTIAPVGSAVTGDKQDSGTVTSATDGTLIDTHQSWIIDQYAGARVESTSVDGETRARIDSNDQTTLTVGPWSNGIPLPGSDYTIYKTALIALITPGDIDAARTLWQQDAPTQFRGLLDNSGGWWWDNEHQSYVSRHGHQLTDTALKALAVMFLLAVEADMRADASSMAVGLTPIDTWQRNMANAVKDVSIIEGALAVGGFNNLKPEWQDRIVGTPDKAPGIAFSLARLQGFAEDAEDGRYDDESAILDRAGMYAESSASVYEDLRRESHREARDTTGRLVYLYEQNILGDTQHCADTASTEGCASLPVDWVPIGTLPMIGCRTCGPKCGCQMRYSLTGGQHVNN